MNVVFCKEWTTEVKVMQVKAVVGGERKKKQEETAGLGARYRTLGDYTCWGALHRGLRPDRGTSYCQSPATCWGKLSEVRSHRAGDALAALPRSHLAGPHFARWRHGLTGGKSAAIQDADGPSMASGTGQTTPARSRGAAPLGEAPASDQPNPPA